MSSLLAIYLNDHLAGATAGLELARRAHGSNSEGERGAFLATLVTEIDEDREVLRGIIRAVGAGEDRVKVKLAWVGEKAGRLKLNGQLTGYSPLSRVVELEGLSLGVAGKLALWRMLEALDDPRLSGFGFPELIARAERQRDGLEQHRVEAGRLALRDSG